MRFKYFSVLNDTQTSFWGWVKKTPCFYAILHTTGEMKWHYTGEKRHQIEEFWHRHLPTLRFNFWKCCVSRHKIKFVITFFEGSLHFIDNPLDRTSNDSTFFYEVAGLLGKWQSGRHPCLHRREQVQGEIPEWGNLISSCKWAIVLNLS